MIAVMETVRRRPASLLLLLFAAIVLVGCHTTVPNPTVSLDAMGKPLPRYNLQNIGPQRSITARSVYFSDMNADGAIDLLIGTERSVDGFHIEWGNGKGQWRLQAGPPTSMRPRGFAVDDVDGDGISEILIGGEGDQRGLQVWSNQEGAWQLESVPSEVGVYRDVVLADLNDDGWPDIVAARTDSEQKGGVPVWMNNGSGGWVKGFDVATEGYFTDVAVADLNQDGHRDIVAARRSGTGSREQDGSWRQVGGLQLWYGDGSGRWQTEVLAAEGDVESVTVADVNGDGRLDIVAGFYQKGIAAWLRGSSGWSKRQVTDENSWTALRVGDLDADGKRELVAASSDGHGLGVWTWQGGFSRRTGWLPNYGVYLAIDLGDTYGSGRLDVAAVRADAGVEVWSATAAEKLEVREVGATPTGEELLVLFDSGSALLDTYAESALEHWFVSQGKDIASLQLRLEGHADPTPIHSEEFPNNMALSRARAEAVAAWLRSKGVAEGALRIDALGDKGATVADIAAGADKLRIDRRVRITAYKKTSARLPATAEDTRDRNLFNVVSNKVFKTIDGIPEYRVGPGDELALIMWQGGKSTEHKVVVQIDGVISLPYQEGLQVNGLTPREIDGYVTKLLSRYERRPRVDVRVLKHINKKASIFGEVQSLVRQPTGPGVYALKGKENLVEFLSRAGGPGSEADLTRVQVNRGGKTIILNLERAIKYGDSMENAIVDDGDTVFVPSLAQSKRRVYVLGEVGKPGIVEFSGDIRLLDAVSQAGGFGKDAYYPDIRVVRSNQDRPLIFAVSFDAFLEKGDLTQNLALQDKDVILIPRRPIANWNQWINDIMPTLNVLTTPINTYQQILIIRDLTRRLP